jgi:hypothetical protein
MTPVTQASGTPMKKPVERLHQAVLIVSLLLLSWLMMQAVHEFGHVLAAWLTGGSVERVVLHPLTISRTDLACNPYPLVTVWAGPVLGVVLPLAAWAVCSHWPWSYLPRFFAGFCMVANGVYIGAGVVDLVGDAREMLRHGSPAWLLAAFGVATIPAGFWLWHRQGEHFGLGRSAGQTDARAAYVCLALLAAVAGIELAFGGE